MISWPCLRFDLITGGEVRYKFLGRRKGIFSHYTPVDHTLQHVQKDIQIFLLSN